MSTSETQYNLRPLRPLPSLSELQDWLEAISPETRLYPGSHAYCPIAVFIRDQWEGVDAVTVGQEFLDIFEEEVMHTYQLTEELQKFIHIYDTNVVAGIHEFTYPADAISCIESTQLALKGRIPE